MQQKKIEAQIIAKPDDVERYLVYGDWLEGRGDPRGELIALQYARLQAPQDTRIKAAEAKLIGEQRGVFLGGLQEHLDCFYLHWHLGFVQSARMFRGPSLHHDERGDEAAALLSRFLRHPSCRFLRSFSLGQFPWTRHAEDLCTKLLNAIVDARPPVLRSLFVFDHEQHWWQERTDLAQLLDTLPTLEDLNLSGRFVLGEGPNLSGLRQLTLDLSAEDLAESLNTLGREGAPGLEELALWCGEVENIETLAPLFGAEFGQLRHLRLWSLSPLSGLVEAIAHAPMATRLERLDLSGGTLNAKGAKELTRLRHLFPQLHSLRLDQNLLTPKGCDALMDAFPQVYTAAQRKARSGTLDYWSDACWRSPGKARSFVGMLVQRLLAHDRADAQDAKNLLRRLPLTGRMLYNKGTFLIAAPSEAKRLEARALLSLSMELPDPMFSSAALENLAIAHANERDFHVAVELSRRGLVISPKRPNLWAILIDALRHLRCMEDALQAVAEGQHTLDFTASGLSLLEDCMLTHLVAGSPQQALALFENAHRADRPLRPKTFACAVLAACHMRDLRHATEFFKEVRAWDDPQREHCQACMAVLKHDEAGARQHLQSARTKGYVELRLCDNEDPLLHALTKPQKEKA
ncbi:MAG: TIGR02996 domain-containing protein [Deltaproteobacteria bacterium]|nr:TIGR02996 domain-containing protein [Deltaproteobacteria bacterium]